MVNKTEYKLSQRSLDKLQGVHRDLQRVIKEAITCSPYDFGITEGLRTIERQKQLVAEGKSRTMNSRHLKGLAVDIACYINGNVTWDFAVYKEVADHIKAVAKLNDVKITWGGDWEGFRDGPHFQIELD